MIDIELLKDICKIPGAPGFEHNIRQRVIEEIKGFCDRCEIDRMGNLIAVKKGKTDNKLAIAAHLDEISFMVHHIDDEGFIRFKPLGGFDAKTLTAQRVIIHGKEDIVGVMGCKPIHIMTLEERKKAIQISDFFIDTGMSVDKVKELISPGDSITRERKLIEMGDCINSKSLDNRISVYMLIELLRSLDGKTPSCDIYALFSVQEEVGLRGAISASRQIDPHYGIALDVTIANDLPGSQPHEKISSLGEGVAIKMMDGRTICDIRMVRFMKEVAEKSGIKWQAEIMDKGGTDTAALQRYGKSGSIAGALSIPTRYIHQHIEMCHKEDVKNCIDLLVELSLEIDDFSWTY